jgi:cold shock protein
MPFDAQLQQHLNRQTPAATERRSEKPAPAHEGRVIVYDSKKRYGFVAQAGDGDDIFVHARELAKAGIANLLRGDQLRFDIEPDKRGGRPVATNLRLAA